MATAVLADHLAALHLRSYRRKTDRLRAWESEPDGIPVLRPTQPRELGLTLLLAGWSESCATWPRTEPGHPRGWRQWMPFSRIFRSRRRALL